MEFNYVSDGLRIINSTNTQTRRLAVVSAIINSIGKRQLPIELLKIQMIKWSLNLEETVPGYVKKTGLLTSKSKPTSAFEKYILFIKDLGLVHQIGSMLSLTTSGYILFALLRNGLSKSGELSEKERLFYLYFLIYKDADYLLLVLDMLCKNGQGIQSEFQKMFQPNLLSRLKAKVQICNRQTLSKVNEKIRTISNVWQNAASYAEHIIPPRLEWLLDLGLVEKEKNVFFINPKGRLFLKQLENIGKEKIISEINNSWFNITAFSSFSIVLEKKEKVSNFNELVNRDKDALIGECLTLSSNLLRSGSSLKIALRPSLIFSAIHSLCVKNIVLEFEEIITRIKENFFFENKQYIIREAARINEGYIIIKLLG